MADTSARTPQDLERRVLAALLLRSLAIAVGAAAATVAALAWVERWEGSPSFGLATYLFWPLLVSALALLGSAARLMSPEADGTERADPRSR